MIRGERHTFATRLCAAALAVGALIGVVRVAHYAAEGRAQDVPALRTVTGVDRQPQAIVERLARGVDRGVADLSVADVPRRTDVSIARWSTLLLVGAVAAVLARLHIAPRLRGPPVLTGT